MKKIAIIGNAGSGKSTLARALHKKTNLPLYHLDQYFWLPGWQEVGREKFSTIHKQLCDEQAWIIEGVATRFFAYRFEKADIIVFLDYPVYVCLYRTLKRMVTHFGKVYFSSAKGCVEKFPTIKFLKFILLFNRQRKPIIEALIAQHRGKKEIIVLKNDQQAQ